MSSRETELIERIYISGFFLEWLTGLWANYFNNDCLLKEKSKDPVITEAMKMNGLGGLQYTTEPSKSRPQH